LLTLGTNIASEHPHSHHLNIVNFPQKLYLFLIKMPGDWQCGGQSSGGGQVYYNPNKGNNAMTTYNPGSGQQTMFAFKNRDVAIKFKGDPDSHLAHVAGTLALMAAQNQRR